MAVVVVGFRLENGQLASKLASCSKPATQQAAVLTGHSCKHGATPLLALAVL